jgi:hypothetical protein
MSDPESRIREGLQAATQAAARTPFPVDAAGIAASHRLLAATKFKIVTVAASLALVGGVAGGFAVTRGGPGHPSQTPRSHGRFANSAMAPASPDVLLDIENGGLEALSPVNGALIKQYQIPATVMAPAVSSLHASASWQVTLTLAAVAAEPRVADAYAEYVGQVTPASNLANTEVRSVTMFVKVPLDGSAPSLQSWHTGSPTAAPALSPNGEFLAYDGPGNHIYLTNVTGANTASRNLDDAWTGISAIAWAPDSQQLDMAGTTTSGGGTYLRFGQLQPSSSPSAKSAFLGASSWGTSRGLASDATVNSMTWTQSGAVLIGGSDLPCADSTSPCSSPASIISFDSSDASIAENVQGISSMQDVYALNADPVTGALAVLAKSQQSNPSPFLGVVGYPVIRRGEGASPQWVSERSLGAVTQQPGISGGSALPGGVPVTTIACSSGSTGSSGSSGSSGGGQGPPATIIIPGTTVAVTGASGVSSSGVSGTSASGVSGVSGTAVPPLTTIPAGSSGSGSASGSSGASSSGTASSGTASSGTASSGTASSGTAGPCCATRVSGSGGGSTSGSSGVTTGTGISSPPNTGTVIPLPAQTSGSSGVTASTTTPVPPETGTTNPSTSTGSANASSGVSAPGNNTTCVYAGSSGSSGTTRSSGVTGPSGLSTSTTTTTPPIAGGLVLPTTSGATAAESNLQTALTGSLTYYTEANQSYTGLMGGGSVSSITQIDTGLAIVTSSHSSDSAHTVSINNPNGNEIVLVAYDPNDKICFGILDVKGAQASAYFAGFSQLKKPGTYFFAASEAASTCTASSTTTTFIKDGGW